MEASDNDRQEQHFVRSTRADIERNRTAETCNPKEKPRQRAMSLTEYRQRTQRNPSKPPAVSDLPAVLAPFPGGAGSSVEREKPPRTLRANQAQTHGTTAEEERFAKALELARSRSVKNLSAVPADLHSTILPYRVADEVTTRAAALASQLRNLFQLLLLVSSLFGIIGCAGLAKNDIEHFAWWPYLSLLCAALFAVAALYADYLAAHIDSMRVRLLYPLDEGDPSARLEVLQK